MTWRDQAIGIGEPFPSRLFAHHLTKPRIAAAMSRINHDYSTAVLTDDRALMDLVLFDEELLVDYLARQRGQA